MIEIFKTTVNSEEQSNKIVILLQQLFPKTSFIFDLEDCDKILRVEPIERHQIGIIMEELSVLGFRCEILEG